MFQTVLLLLKHGKTLTPLCVWARYLLHPTIRPYVTKISFQTRKALTQQRSTRSRWPRYSSCRACCSSGRRAGHTAHTPPSHRPLSHTTSRLWTLPAAELLGKDTAKKEWALQQGRESSWKSQGLQSTAPCTATAGSTWGMPRDRETRLELCCFLLCSVARLRGAKTEHTRSNSEIRQI